MLSLWYPLSFISCQCFSSLSCHHVCSKLLMFFFLKFIESSDLSDASSTTCLLLVRPIGFILITYLVNQGFFPNLPRVRRRRMARHHPHMMMCRNLAGTSFGQVCTNCEGRCILCDSHANLIVPARICDECVSGPNENKCVICQQKATGQAYYCSDCVELEYDRDGCPFSKSTSTHRVAKHFDAKKHVKPR